MANSQVSICNAALRQLGVAKITALSDSVEQARILTDIYDAILDEVLAAHPWNFAIKRATLTALGGTITTWTASGTTNVWQAALTTEPARVEFDGIEGDEQASAVACDAAYNWYWASNVLYVYSTSDADTAFSKIEAFIPEFDWDYAYSLPSDCLRIIKAEDDVDFIKEATYLLSNESTLKIKYIAQITDPTKYPPAFVTMLIMRLAAEIAYPLTNDVQKAQDIYKLYLDRLRTAKAIDAQEGISDDQQDESNWQEGRK